MKFSAATVEVLKQWQTDFLETCIENITPYFGTIMPIIEWYIYMHWQIIKDYNIFVGNITITLIIIRDF
jgi:hypothetical protein